MSVQNGPQLTTYQCAADRLRQAGFRITRQRAQLLQLLVEGRLRGEHLDAESLYQQARGRNMQVSLATVYRALAVFKQLGLVEPRVFAHDSSREFYEAATVGEHYHFTCLSCGAVLEFELPGMQAALRDVAEHLGVEMHHSNVYLEGRCPDCQRA